MNEVLTNQQGDVLFFHNANIPDKVQRAKPKDGRWILAEGEVTGHAHVIEDLKNCTVYVAEDGTLYVTVDASVTVKHETHGPQTLERGNYRIGIVRERDPYEDVIRKVAD